MLRAAWRAVCSVGAEAAYWAVQTDDAKAGDWELQKVATGAAGSVCAAAAAKDAD